MQVLGGTQVATHSTSTYLFFWISIICVGIKYMINIYKYGDSPILGIVRQRKLYFKIGAEWKKNSGYILNGNGNIVDVFVPLELR